MNTKRVFTKFMCSLKDFLRCVVALLKDEAYEWWKALSFMASRDRITWDSFQAEFRKKYVSRLFLDKKKKEFIELKQGNRSVAKYD